MAETNFDFNRDAQGALRYFLYLEEHFNERIRVALEAEETSPEDLMFLRRIQLMQMLMVEFVSNLGLIDSSETKLRSSQTRALDNFYHFLKQMGRGGSRGYFRQPTGAGKTVLMGMITKLLNQRTIILVPTNNLLNHTRRELLQLGFCEADVGIIGEGENERDKKVAITTYAGLRHNPELVKDRALVLCDEAHRALGDATQEVISAVDLQALTAGNILLGFTATPHLAHKSVDDCFGVCIDETSYGELIKLLILRKIRLLSVDGKVFESDFADQGEDFSPERESEILDREGIYQKQINEYKQLKEALKGDEKSLRTAVFCSTVDEAKKFQTSADANHLKAVVITGEVADISLEEAEEKLLSGEIDIIITVDKLAEGWNFPPLNCVILARATMSPVKILQPVGRAMRNTDPMKQQYAYVIYTEWLKLRGSTGSGVNEGYNTQTVVSRPRVPRLGAGGKTPLSVVAAFARLGVESLGDIFEKGDEPIDFQPALHDYEKDLTVLIIENIKQQVPSADEWAKMGKPERGRFRVLGLYGLRAVAASFGLNLYPVNVIADHLVLGRVIYGEGIECLEVKRITTEELKAMILAQCPSAERWAAMRTPQRNSFKVIFRGKKLGLNAIASLYGLSINPLNDTTSFFALGRAIYGDDIECLKVKEITIEELRALILAQCPSAEVWVAMDRLSRRSFKVSVGDEKLGLGAISTIFGFLGEAAPGNNVEVFLELGRKIYGEDNDCLQGASKELIKSTILKQIPTAQTWALMTRTDKDVLQIQVGSKKLGIQSWAKIFGTTGNPLYSHEAHLELGKAIYGSDQPCLEKLTAEEIRVAIAPQVSCLDDWLEMNFRRRASFRVTLKGLELGLYDISRMLGFKNKSPVNQFEIHKALGEMIFNETSTVSSDS